jgi:hypothetical protein
LKTILDESHSSFLHVAVYSDGELRVVVAEGFRAATPEDIMIAGRVIKNLYAINISEESRHVELRFTKPIAWQLVDESFTTWDEDEERDDKATLQVLSRSKYLDYVRVNHGWFEDIRGQGMHYRVSTENEVVDVVACEPPTVGLTASR